MTAVPLPPPFRTIPLSGSTTVSIYVWGSDALIDYGDARAAEAAAAEREACDDRVAVAKMRRVKSLDLREELERCRALLLSCKLAMEASEQHAYGTDWSHMIAAIDAAMGTE